MDSIEAAHGISYKEIASGKEFIFVIPDTALRMLAVFGAKTKATNEASAFRQAEAKGEDPGVADQLARRLSQGLADVGERSRRKRSGRRTNVGRKRTRR